MEHTQKGGATWKYHVQMLNANKPQPAAHAYGQIYILGHVQNGGDYATNEKIACILLGARVKK